MFRSTLLAVLCISFALASDWERPLFCNENDCPIFKVLAQENGYEVREYEPARWVSTIVYATTAEEADEQLSLAFNKLFNYIDGGNDRAQSIAMTAPVATKVVPSSGPNGETKFTRSFYIPYDLQEDTPLPTNADVFLTDAPAETVYIRSFDDYATQQDYIDNTIALAEAIGDSSKYVSEYFYQNGYDSPYKWWERHNEVWLVAEDATKKQ